MDSRKKNLKLRDAPATFKSQVLTHFSFYNINGTNKIFVFMLVMYANCILQLDRYRDVSFFIQQLRDIKNVTIFYHNVTVSSFIQPLTIAQPKTWISFKI